MPLGWVAAAAFVGDAIQGYSASQASSLAGAQLGMEETIFGEQQQYAGLLQQLIANPSSVSSLPGYQFQLDQGSQAVARQMAASGFLGSGNEAIALEQYGQGLAQNFYTTQANLLASLSGLTNASSPSQLGTSANQANANSAAQVNNLLAQMGIFAGRYGNSSGITSSDMSFLAGGGYSSIGPTMSAGGGYTYNTPGWGN